MVLPICVTFLRRQQTRFLDEPTSGLDSTTSYDLVHALRRIAEGGVNVVAVLHQPSAKIYRLFHDCLFLGRGGRTAYLGPSDSALPYFQVCTTTCLCQFLLFHNTLREYALPNRPWGFPALTMKTQLVRALVEYIYMHTR